MPTYEYECSSCGYVFEKFQNMNDKPLTNCPKCNKKIKRLIGSGAGIIFKGSGFYATDYRRTKPANKTPTNCPMANQGCKSCDKKQS